MMLNQSSPLVSVIVPIFNVERYIDKCLDSLFAQSYENMQYVFVNDCTPDGSVARIYDKLKQYAHRESQVTVVNHPVNRGLTAARKTGLLYAQGDYCWHIDSDDYIADDAVECLVNKSLQEDADMVVFDMDELYADCTKHVKLSIPTSKAEYLNQMLVRKTRFELWFRFCRRTVYEGIDLDETVCYSEDYATSPRLVYQSNKIVHLHKVCYFYIKNNPTSYTASVGVNSIKSLEKATLILDDFFVRKDAARFESIMSLAKIFVKIHSMKSTVSNPQAFQYSASLFPDVKQYDESQVVWKDKVILCLLRRKLIRLLTLYIKAGLYLMR